MIGTAYGTAWAPHGTAWRAPHRIPLYIGCGAASEYRGVCGTEAVPTLVLSQWNRGAP
jgi:hypothetical protein